MFVYGLLNFSFCNIILGFLKYIIFLKRNQNMSKKHYPENFINTTVWRFLKKLEIELPYDPAIPLLGIHTKETRIERDTRTPMFIAALFIIARTWKHPRCPSADEWIRKLWYIYTQWSITQPLKRIHLNQF